MAKEIERKFLVTGDEWRKGAVGSVYRQGYLCRTPERTVRVRLAAGRGFVTIKGKTTGAVRDEFEYEIPAADAEAMLTDLCEKPLIEKTRYLVKHAGLTWEIDEFHGDNAGLIVAEVELQAADQRITKPAWVGREVTDDPRYYNASLVIRPFNTW